MHRHRERDSEPGRPTAPARRSRERRILLVGLVLSTLLHGIVLVGTHHLLDPTSSPAESPGPVLVEPPAGLRAVMIRKVPGPAVAEPAPPDPPAETPAARADADPPAEERPERVVQLDTAAQREPVLADRTAADRLTPRVVDPRLWEPVVVLSAGARIDEVEARVGAAVALLGDSALAAAERAVRSRDWTVESESGKRWGISPGMLHLGDVKMPLPIFFEVDPDAQAEREMWYDLQAQIDRARILESFESRVKAIRERRDRERTERREGGG